MTPRTDLTANELCEILNANLQGCNQYGCKGGGGGRRVKGPRKMSKAEQKVQRVKALTHTLAMSLAKGGTKSAQFRKVGVLRDTARRKESRDLRTKVAGMLKKARAEGSGPGTRAFYSVKRK